MITVVLFVEDVRLATQTLAAALGVDAEVSEFELDGRTRHRAVVNAGAVQIVLTDTGSLTHSDIVVEVPDLVEAQGRVHAAGLPTPPLLHLDGVPTMQVAFGPLSIYLVNKTKERHMLDTTFGADADAFAEDLRRKAELVCRVGWTGANLEETDTLGVRAVLDPAAVADADEVWADVLWTAEEAEADAAAGFARTRAWFASVRR